MFRSYIRRLTSCKFAVVRIVWATCGYHRTTSATRDFYHLNQMSKTNILLVLEKLKCLQLVVNHNSKVENFRMPQNK